MTLWYPDSGANSHITSSLDHIQHPCAFHGKCYILAADDSPMQIYQSSLSNVQWSSSFVLKDLFFVPTATKNLLSINPFCIDNDILIHIDAQMVEVQDIASNKLMMHGKVDGGLYQLPINIWREDQALSVVKCMNRLWHLRLEHFILNVIDLVAFDLIDLPIKSSLFVNLVYSERLMLYHINQGRLCTRILFL